MKQIIFSILAFFAFVSVKADSPITSTNFSVAYQDISMVSDAESAGGKITVEIMKFLAGKKPIDQKMAVINALGWNMEGQSNYSKFKDYLHNHGGMKKGKRKAANLLSLAYLKAMDDYFDCTEALSIANQAIKFNSESYTFNIIHGLIKAQVMFDSSWCELFKAVDSVRNNDKIKMDMRPDAINIIFEYMDLYKDEC